jgi:hypothetical protein
MARLFGGGVPDVERVASDAGIDADAAQMLLLELAWVTKTITRVGKGYLLGGQGFSRPNSAADQELSAANALGGDYEVPEDTAWVSEDELSVTLADRTGAELEVTDEVVASVSGQVSEHTGAPLKVATKLLELERFVEDQLMSDLSVLDIWGWGLGDVRRQVRLDAQNRADIVGRRRDGTWVVVELKRGAALEETARQVLRYLPLVQAQFAGGGQVEALVIADGDDEEFHDIAIGVPEMLTYLPTRCLNLPVCRPQVHRCFDGEVPVGVVALAADGLTVVDASPSLATFDILEPSELATAGRRIKERYDYEVVPLTPLELP